MHGQGGRFSVATFQGERAPAPRVENSVRLCGQTWNGSASNAESLAKPCLQIAAAPAIMEPIVDYKEVTHEPLPARQRRSSRHRGDHTVSRLSVVEAVFQITAATR